MSALTSNADQDRVPIRWRDVDPRTPGSGRDLAVQKRRLEKQLRADGWSRAAAVAEVARRYDADRA